MERERRKSSAVTLTMVGVVGVMGLCFCSCDSKDEAAEEATIVEADQPYANNHFISGVGFYHAPFGGWFPFPYNRYEAGRGYFAGGSYHQSKHESAVRESRPDSSTVSQINQRWRVANPAVAAQRKADLASARRSARGGFGRTHSGYGT
jgi:hypothetical protein